MILAHCQILKDVIFKVSEDIRYFGFLDNRSGMVISELRRKDRSHNPEAQLVRDLTFFKGAMASWALYFGHVSYSVVAHDSFKIVMFPVESGLVIITTEGSFPLQGVEEVSKIVKEEILSPASKV